MGTYCLINAVWLDERSSFGGHRSICLDSIGTVLKFFFEQPPAVRDILPVFWHLDAFASSVRH
jgi:hypothetical protein